MGSALKNLYAMHAPRFLASLVARRREREHLRIIDLEPVRILRGASPDDLRRSDELERLLPRLGLTASANLVPPELRPFTGTGLWHWQHPRQFSGYLARISGLPIRSYLEIGVKYGGTFVITVEYLSRFGVVERAVGVDANFCPSLVRYNRMNPRATFVQLNTRDPQFAKMVEAAGGFDLVLIDGDHAEDGCRKDFEILYPRANVLVFHDIVNEYTPGPGVVWREVKSRYGDEFEFSEYVDQYPEIARALGRTVLGLGVAVRKQWRKTRVGE